MSFFSDHVAPHLFDNERKQRRDIQRLKHTVEGTIDGENARAVGALRKRLDALEQRVDQAELVCESLVEFIVDNDWATSDEISSYIQRIEQERKTRNSSDSPDSVARENPPEEIGAEPPATISCGGCGQDVPKRDSFMTANGPRCSSCYL